MKKQLVTALTIMFCALAALGKSKGYEPLLDELVPWPWGTECQFPWDTIHGAWNVKGRPESLFNRHTLIFEPAVVREGVNILYIYHLNAKKEMIGQGTGYSDKDNKLIKAVMTFSNGQGRGYEIIVRAYAKDVMGAARCSGGKTAMAVTFCPRNGRKCMETSNYLLER